MHLTVPGEVPKRRKAAAASVGRFVPQTRHSQLLWGEHCSECAMPSCYATCAYYTPRADFRCRRFANGIELIVDGHGAPAFGVSFRQWGKLEAEGRGTLASPAAARRIERICGGIERILLAAKPFGRAYALLVRAFNRTKKSVLPLLGQSNDVAAFVVECLSETAEPVAFTLTIRSKEATQSFFQQNFTLTPGQNRITIDAGPIAARVPLTGELLVQIEPLRVPAENRFVFTFLDFVAAAPNTAPASAKAPAARGPAAAIPTKESSATFCKCLVWDLDNTVWRGTLIEDGIANLKLDPLAVAAIHELDKRGILQSVASKNDERDVLEALDHFGLRDYFLYPQIHWSPKSSSLPIIAAQLNIGIDSLALIDDQPFELAEVSAALPSVRTIAAADLATLLEQAIFDVPATAESRRRRQMYREDEQRSVAAQAAGDDFTEFLRGCAIELTLAPLDANNRERIFELTQRTNQLNYAGRRYSRQAIDALDLDEKRCAYVLSCRDRFGDYGIIGFAVLDREAFEVENFFMSCRVQGKRVDHAFFGLLARAANAGGRDTLLVRFRSTGKNEPARHALKAIGFAEGAADAEGVSHYRIATALPLMNDDIVAIVDRISAVAPTMAAAGAIA